MKITRVKGGCPCVECFPQRSLLSALKRWWRLRTWPESTHKEELLMELENLAMQADDRITAHDPAKDQLMWEIRSHALGLHAALERSTLE